MQAVQIPSRFSRGITYLAAPLLLNILFFALYLYMGIDVLDPKTRIMADSAQSSVLLMLRLGGFAVPILYVIIRTRLLTRSIAGHEVALLIFSAWILAGMGDILRLLNSEIITTSKAIFYGAKIAAFAVTALFGTAYLVQVFKRALLKERHFFLERSIILVLFSVAYVSVALMVLAIYASKSESRHGLYAGAVAVIVLMVALNVYGFLLFRSFYSNLGLREFTSKATISSNEIKPDSQSATIREKFSELFSVIDMLGDKKQNVAGIQSRLRDLVVALRRQMQASERYPNQILQPLQQAIRIIDRTKPARFLIIDSNAVSRRVLSAHLAHHSECRADVTENGKDGLHAALSLSYDVIFVALDLTDMAGTAVARILRENGLNTTLVACADAGCSLEPDALMAGFDRYLERPFDHDEISLHMEHILAKF